MKKIMLIISLLSTLTLRAQEYQDWIYSNVAAQVVRYEKDNIISYDLGNCNFITFDFIQIDETSANFTMTISPTLFGYQSSDFKQFDDVQIKSEHFTWEASVIHVTKFHILLLLNKKTVRDIALNDMHQIKITRDGQLIAEWNFKYPESLCISNCAFCLWKEIEEKFFMPKTGELTLEQRTEKKRIQMRQYTIESTYPKFQ